VVGFGLVGPGLVWLVLVDRVPHNPTNRLQPGRT
jgi:hypothetical protein